MSEPPVLWHLIVSNYNEKARWALDFKGVPHRRRAVPPGFQAPVAMAMTRKRTFPILKIDGRAIGESAEIVEELERRFPEPPLYPGDPAERARALELERSFDEELGHDCRRLVFDAWYQEGRMAELIAAGGGPPEAIGRVLFARSVIGRYYGMDEARMERARERFEAAAERAAAERAGGDYLVGERFSVADLTFAALVGPTVAPPEFPFDFPRQPQAMEGVTALLDRHGMLDWVRTMYARHRGSWIRA